MASIKKLNTVNALMNELKSNGFEAKTFQAKSKYERKNIGQVTVGSEIFTSSYTLEEGADAGKTLYSLIVVLNDEESMSITISTEKDNSAPNLSAAKYNIVKLTLKEGAEHDYMNPGDSIFRAQAVV